MEPITTIDAVKIITEINTLGSAPLRIIASNNQTYIAKTTTKALPPVELINEIVCAYFCLCWGLKVPNFALIKISDQVIENFQADGNQLSDKYYHGFNDRPLFGSEEIAPVIELESYIDIASKHDFNKYASPGDLFKIGVLDLWVGNKDRKPDNTNILIGINEPGFDFHPIDHAAAFGFLENYREVRGPLLRIDPHNSILYSQFAKKMANFITDDELEQLKDDIHLHMENTVDQLDFIFEQIPNNWGFGKKSKKHLKDFFSNKDRNKETLHIFLSFLR